MNRRYWLRASFWREFGRVVFGARPAALPPRFVDLNSHKVALSAIEEACAGCDRLAVIIMPRDMGPSPLTPRGHSAIWSRADVVLEWHYGEFHVVKRRQGDGRKN